MNAYVILIILFSAAITLALRAFPFVVFRGNRQMPQLMKDLGDVLPAAVMAVLIIYCLKSVPSDFSGTGIRQLISVFVVAASYKWKHNTLLSLVFGTACYMILLRLQLF